MEIKTFIDILFKKSLERGLEDFEVYYVASSSTTIKVFDQEVDSYSDSGSQGVSFRVLYKGKMGYSYTESINDEDADFLINEAIENASVIETEDIEEIYGGGGEYTEVDGYNPNLEKVSIEDKISFLKNVEKIAKEMDNRIKRLNYCVLGSGLSTRIKIGRAHV